jgi:hypothetical protein
MKTSESINRLDNAMAITTKGKFEKKMSMIAKIIQNTANIHARYIQA